MTSRAIFKSSKWPPNEVNLFGFIGQTCAVLFSIPRYRMKSSRRIDADTIRRDSSLREREVSHSSGNSRFSRKRPSMLSEFHGSKHYNHSIREGDRDNDPQHYRSHNRYSHDTAGSAVSLVDHTHSFTSSGFYSKSKPDSRNRHSSHHHNQHRSMSHHHHSNSHYHPNFSDNTPEEETPIKRPRLMVDVTRKVAGHSDTPNSADSLASSTRTSGSQSPAMSPPHVSGGGLITYHLEDIDSDDDDSLLRDEDDKKSSNSPTPVPLGSPMETAIGVRRDSPRTSTVPMPSKEELLLMMEKVDRDIAATETQISALQKRQAELEETAKAMASTPRSSTFSLPSPVTPSSEQASAVAGAGEDSPLPSPSPSTSISPKKSQMDIIYSENRGKARSAQSILSSLNFPPLPGLTTLYHQPCEAPHYCDNLLSHQKFRPKLIEYIKQRKLKKYEKELSLCEEYDSQMTKWEKSVERTETNPKKKLRDQKNRELFERCFPELKARREQQERLTRVDQRGYGIVRSDAELKEIMCELSEQEEAPVRYRRTHAVIPPMLLEKRDQRVRFLNTNGLISDPMALHRDSRFISVWSDEEKAIFRDKFMFYPKNFEVIASYLPNKSPADCVQYYYLSKKREKFKHLVRKANLKRRKPFIKPSEFSNPILSPFSLPPPPISLFASTKLKMEEILSPDEEREQPEFGDWSSEDIASLKDGLRKYGRAWGKIYREVGGRKTATQCKQFYDKYCTDKQLELSMALAEHSSMKNAEKLRRKAESRKSVAPVMVETKRKPQQKSRNKPSPLHQGSEEVDSENTVSGYETESNSEDSGSESTITDSCAEEGSSNSGIVLSSQSKSSRGKKHKASCSSDGYRRTSEEALDLFISAAEALNNIVPPEVALHDHTYALPPSSLVNNMELQGTSGLSLIAAAAAVVSPTLSRSAGSNKLPSPVRAPRGRPPNSQRKGTSSTTSKLAPTLLSPAGTSPNVLLTEMKVPPLRGRARSAPSDRPKMPLHVQRAGSTLARMSIHSSGRTVNRGNMSLIPPASYSRHKVESSGSPSLKSMIAFHSGGTSNGSTTTTNTNNNTASTSTSSTSAFEALVNVAVAAPPAELPRSSILGSSSSSSPSNPLSPHNHQHHHTSHHSYSKSSSSGVTTPFTASSLSCSQSKDTVTIAMTGSNSNASNSSGTPTAYIDVNQAINILASLAQQQASSSAQSISVLPNQRLFTQTPVNILGNIMAQTSKSSASGTPMVTSLSSSKGAKTLSVSATVDTLLGHLTSGIGSQTVSARNVMNKGGGGKVKKTVSAKSDTIKTNSNAVNSTIGNKASNSKPSTAQMTASMDDLSNLNLLSSLVAAVAASQPASTPTPTSQVTSHSNLKTSVGQPSSIYSTTTELKRPPPGSVIAVSKDAFTSSSLKDISLGSQKESSSSSSSLDSSQTHTPTSIDTSNDGEKQLEHKREVDKLIASSSSIKKSISTHNSSNSVGTHGFTSGLPTSESASDDLPRSVVRSGLGTVASSDSLLGKQHSNSNHDPAPSENDMTASLASIIPSYNPSSISSQSSLLLYTRSLSFPLATEPVPEEEDHLESATRGISELSKLLGTTDNSSDSNANSRHEAPVYKDMSTWNPSDLLTSSIPSKNTTKEFSSNLTEKSGKPYLSSLLESQIHGTVHHSSLTAPKLNCSASNSNRSESREATLDVDNSR